MKNYLVKNKMIFIVNALLLPVIILICGSCSYYSTHYYDAYNVTKNTYYVTDGTATYDNHHTLIDGEHYTDKIYPNEKQREKAYALQTYLINMYFNEDGLFYKDETVGSMYLYNSIGDYNTVSWSYYSLIPDVDGVLEMTRDNIFNSISFSLNYSADDKESREKVALFKKYVDENFYEGFSDIADRQKYNTLSMNHINRYDKNMFISYNTSVNKQDNTVNEYFKIDYFCTFDYVKGYEMLTDELSENGFLFTGFYLDNELQRLIFQNTKISEQYTTGIELPMKITLTLDNSGVKKVNIVTSIRDMPEKNKNAVYIALKETGASSDEIERIITKISDGSILASSGSKEGSLYVKAGSGFDSEHIILDFWK